MTQTPEPTPPQHDDCDDCTDRQALSIMAWQSDQLVTVTQEGFTGLRDDMRLWGRLFLAALVLIAGLGGVRMVFPDGTVIEPSAAAEVVHDMADADSTPGE